VSRAWPFEQTRSKRVFTNPKEFVEASGEGTDAVVVRIGLNDAQLVLIDGEGAWDRWVYHSVEEAKHAAEDLGVPVHEGEYPEKVRVRINAHRRAPEDFARGAYPEQGAVGPVIPYPENRPRRIEAPKKETAD
jgi:hypothetical protein